MALTIWHNPRCSKSRATLALLQDRGLSPEVRLYLQDAPSADEIRTALALLGVPASALLRAKEAREAGVDTGADDATLIAAMATNPVLIERPLVINGDRAALGRPPEAVLAIL